MGKWDKIATLGERLKEFHRHGANLHAGRVTRATPWKMWARATRPSGPQSRLFAGPARRASAIR